MLFELLNTPLFLMALVVGVISGLVVILYYWRALLNAMPEPVEFILIVLGAAFGGGTAAVIYEEIIYTDEYITQAGPHYNEYVTNVEDNHSERIAEIEGDFNERVAELERYFNERIAGIESSFSGRIGKNEQEAWGPANELKKMRDGLAKCLNLHDKRSGKYLRDYADYFDCKVKKHDHGSEAGDSKCDDPSDHEETYFEECM